MRYDNFDEQAYMNYLMQKDSDAREEANKLRDPVAQEVAYNLVQVATRFSDEEDENAMGLLNSLKSNFDEFKTEMTDWLSEIDSRIQNLEEK